MATRLCRFTFSRKADRLLIEEAIAEAVFAAECIHGITRVRLGVKYYLAGPRPNCLIDTSMEVGQHVAQLVAGLLTRWLGEDSFRVELLETEVVA